MEPSSPSPESFTILIGDDNLSIRNLLTTALKRKYKDRVNIRVAANLGEFLEELHAFPQLCILNLEFITQDAGNMALQELDRAEYSNIPVIVVTGAVTDPPAIKEGYPNVTDVITKGSENEDDSGKYFIPRFLKAVERQLTSYIRWLHISDLHIGRDDGDRNWNALKEALFEDLEAHKDLGKARRAPRAGVPFRPDFLFITGDIAFSGEEAQYKVARKFIEEIWDITKIDRERTFIVPGNHDIIRGACGVKDFRDACRDLRRSSSQPEWDSKLQTHWNNPAFQDVLRNKHQHYLDFVNCCSVSGLYYSKRTEIRDIPVEIVGINSALMSHRNAEDGKGILWIGSPQIQDVHQMGAHAQNPDICRIFLLHHPQRALHLMDAPQWDYMENQGSVLLYGHLHKASIQQIVKPGQRRKHVCIPGGALYVGDKWISQHYNYVEYSHETQLLRVYLRKTTTGQFPQFIRDIELFPVDAPEGYTILK